MTVSHKDIIDDLLNDLKKTEADPDKIKKIEEMRYKEQIIEYDSKK